MTNNDEIDVKEFLSVKGIEPYRSRLLKGCQITGTLLLIVAGVIAWQRGLSLWFYALPTTLIIVYCLGYCVFQHMYRSAKKSREQFIQMTDTERQKLYQMIQWTASMGDSEASGNVEEFCQTFGNSTYRDRRAIEKVTRLFIFFAVLSLVIAVLADAQ